MSLAEPVRVSEEDQVLVITLDRPKANAVDVATSRALYEAFDRLRRDPQLRAGILTGAGDRFFCAGWDLKAAASGEAIEADHGPGGFAGITEFFDIGKPVIAAVNGFALGGGSGLAACADIALAAPDAVFGFSEVKLGIIPAVISPFVLPKIGAHARRYFLTGELFDAETALRIGLIAEIADDLDAAVDRVLSELLTAGPEAVREAKRLIRERPGGEETAQIAARLRAGEEGQEGLRAFLEGRNARLPDGTEFGVHRTPRNPG